MGVVVVGGGCWLKGLGVGGEGAGWWWVLGSGWWVVGGRVGVVGGEWTLQSLALTPLAGSGAFVLGSCRGATLGNAPRSSPVERTGPRRTPRRAPGVLLENLQGDGGVLDGHDHAAVVQVEDVVLLFKHLRETAGGALRAGPGERWEGSQVRGSLSRGQNCPHAAWGAAAESSSLTQGWSEGSWCPQAIPSLPQPPRLNTSGTNGMNAR